MTDSKIPVSVLTGFLGSGKTTVLNYLLRQPGMADIAVIVNEFGDIGLDHLLVRESNEDMVLLNSGCVCCTIRSDLVETLQELYRRRAMDEIPQFRQVIIETTGLADPTSIIHTLLNDPSMTSCYRLDGVITTIDALSGNRQLEPDQAEKQFEPIKQAAIADRLLITKCDLASRDEIDRLHQTLSDLNPGARQIEVAQGEVNPDQLLDIGIFDPAAKPEKIRDWLNHQKSAREGEAGEHSDEHEHEHQHEHGGSSSGSGIDTFTLTYDTPLHWGTIAMCMSMLTREFGENILRIKGLLNCLDSELPIAVQAVQHKFYPPIILEQWPNKSRRSHIVFITRDMAREEIEKALSSYDLTKSPVDQAD